MAKRTEDEALVCADPTKRTLHTDGATADTYPVGTFVMRNGSTKRIEHLSASAPTNSVCVGVVTEHQEVAANDDNLNYQSGYFFMDVAANAVPNQLLWAPDSGSELAIVSGSAGALVAGRFRGTTEDSNLSLVEIGHEYEPAE